jgi:hypothetical protein
MLSLQRQLRIKYHALSDRYGESDPGKLLQQLESDDSRRREKANNRSGPAFPTFECMSCGLASTPLALQAECELGRSCQ